MYFAGIDIGSLTGKVVILKDNDIFSSAIVRVKRNPVLTSEIVYEQALKNANLQEGEIKYCVGTGYGREKIPYADKTLSEITCHGTGAFQLDSSIRTIIDIGGQDCKVIRLDDNGELKDFIMNDKCAAGTGRYLEIMADLLHLSLDELGTISLKSKNAIRMSSVCSIYAQSEVLNYISKNLKTQDIAAGINRAMAERVFSMTKKIVLKPSFTISGGVAKNKGVVKSLEALLHASFVKLPVDSQLIGALGAAFIAKASN